MMDIEEAAELLVQQVDKLKDQKIKKQLIERLLELLNVAYRDICFSNSVAESLAKQLKEKENEVY